MDVWDGKDPVSCYVEHFHRQFLAVQLGYLQLMLVVVAAMLGIAFLAKRRSRVMVATQGSIASLVLLTVVMATCDLLGPFVPYLSATLAGSLFVASVDLSVHRYLKKRATPLLVDGRPLGWRGASVFVVPSQEAFAFTYHRSVYLSAGLLELLSPAERNAVLVHELHHAAKGMSPTLASILAVVSFTFRRASDEGAAHRFAASICGRKALEDASAKLARS